jgi:hypothetical protein
MDKTIEDLDHTNTTLDKIITNMPQRTIGSAKIPLDNVSGAIDKFQEEADARKKDIEDLKFFTEISKDAICQSFDCNIKKIREDVNIMNETLINKFAENCREVKNEINDIRKQLNVWIVVFGAFLLFLLFGFIYCIMSK